MKIVRLKSLVLLVLMLVASGVAWKLWDAQAERSSQALATPVVIGDQSRRLIGPVATVQEEESDLDFMARVDTGATRCSLHVAEWFVDGGSSEMIENLGKAIRFRLENRRGESTWLERTIAEVALIRTSEQEEIRYLVPLSLNYGGVEREVLVSLNDRSHMQYAMLLGRNFLEGEFVVDVARPAAFSPGVW